MLVAFTDKVTVEPYPDFEKVIKAEPASRIGKIEVVARWQTFTEERSTVKALRPLNRLGCPITKSSRSSSIMPARFLPVETIEMLPDRIMRLENEKDIAELAGLWP